MPGSQIDPMVNGDRAPQNQHSDNEQMLVLSRRFQDLVNDCPPEVNARQRVLSERRNGSTYMQIITSFRVADDSLATAAEITSRSTSTAPPIGKKQSGASKNC